MQRMSFLNSLTHVYVYVSRFTSIFFFFFFNDTATTEIYPLSLHDALPIYAACRGRIEASAAEAARPTRREPRSEEHTSELQSRLHLVCRLLLEKKKKKKRHNDRTIKPMKTKRLQKR